MQTSSESKTELSYYNNEYANDLNYPRGLLDFLTDWDKGYQNKVAMIELFQSEKTNKLSQAQKRFFIKVFYHLRGHFAEFLWYMGSFAPNAKAKEMILSNIKDEFNPNGYSHEQLYLLFAAAFDVDLKYELIENTSYLPFAKEYIDGQLKWLRANDWDHRLAAFAAIERLDNVDYANFREVAISIGAKDKHLAFFNVHISADHFEGVLKCEFAELWKKNSAMIREVFEFIHDYQIAMLQNLSDAVFSFNG